jgi:hypothetical protein
MTCSPILLAHAERLDANERDANATREIVVRRRSLQAPSVPDCVQLATVGGVRSSACV